MPSESALQPFATLPLETDPGGSSLAPRLRVTGDAVYVVKSTRAGWSWDAIKWHAPDVAALALVLAAVFFMRIAWKARRRGRKSGVVYCAWCNHELVPPQIHIEAGVARWADPEGRCPECGKSRPPEFAGDYARRAKWKALACACTIALSAVLLFATLKGKEEAARSVNSLSAWPLWQLPHVLEDWPFFRSTPSETLRRTAIWRVPTDPRAGTPIRVLAGAASGGAFASPDGRLIALVTGPGEIEAFDATTQEHLRFRVAADPASGTFVSGFGKSAVFVCIVGHDPNVRVEFLHINVPSGKSDRIGFFEVPNSELLVSSFLFPAAAETADGPRWAFVGTTYRSDAKYRVFAFIGGPEGWKRIDIDRDSPLTPAHIAPDISGVLLEWDPTDIHGRSSSTGVWDFEMNQIEARAAMSPPGGAVLRFEQDSIVRSVWRVIDEHSGKQVAELNGPVVANGGWFASPDGTFVANWEWIERPSWVANILPRWPPIRSGELKIWKLAPPTP